MFLRLVLALILLVPLARAAEKFKLDLPNPTTVGASALERGRYTVEVDGDRAVFKRGKQVMAEVSITVESVNMKYRDNTISVGNGKLQAIGIKDTTTRYVIK